MIFRPVPLLIQHPVSLRKRTDATPLSFFFLDWRELKRPESSMAIACDSTSANRPPKYPGEDTTPTSQREIRGWYAYGIAAEVFAVCGVGMAIPFAFYCAIYWQR